ncbi:trans-2,3-enoyl-CoA reductase-like isoform X1 [Chiloscyllium plagiosum]|uniref:trans-2,3-enoyl-CoA reductase-like isoform X1 n=1 Tax=Chiloscyllium plagiosum TaxID=36176 RepID=UPI001CB8356A|nr:trans-2,3-enoyl-CoA reductase-like isoform X1 [Chiloscyllium plagiosum]
MHALCKGRAAIKESMVPEKQNEIKSFLSLSQMVLTTGHFGQYAMQKHSKISYVEVEILDAQTKKQICILEKILPSFTIADVKHKFHKICPQWHPSRVGLQLECTGPLLNDTKVVKNLAASSIVTLYFRDLGTQISWITVFLTEYTGRLLIYLLFYFRILNLYETEEINHSRRHPVVHLACICHSLHYIKQILETLFVHSFTNGNTALKKMLKGCAFYWGFTMWMAYYINHPLYTPPSFGNRQIIPAMVCFLVCGAGNYFTNVALVQVHKTGTRSHFVRPTYNPFTWLFKLVSCPNYTYEMGTWISFTIMTQTLPVAVFALMVSLQLIFWAQRKHCKYQKDFKNYPSCRTAMIPLIL